MTYLYAGLGILMMSGIVAIFNMSLKITSQPIQAIFSENKYQKNKFDVKDKIFLELLQNASKDWGFGNNFCDKILSVINESSSDFSDLKNYKESLPSPSLNEKISDSCTFIDSNHRVLIKPKSQENKSFYFFSCAANLKKTDYCDFEEN